MRIQDFIDDMYELDREKLSQEREERRKKEEAERKKSFFQKTKEKIECSDTGKTIVNSSAAYFLILPAIATVIVLLSAAKAAGGAIGAYIQNHMAFPIFIVSALVLYPKLVGKRDQRNDK